MIEAAVLTGSVSASDMFGQARRAVAAHIASSGARLEALAP
jgi:hypothetical protein